MSEIEIFMSKNLRQIRDRIAATNEQFKQADRAGKRVMLAQDIFMQLNNGRMEAASAYLTPDGNPDFLHQQDRQSKEVRDLLLNVDYCEVCGIGSLFMAAVERIDDLRLSQLLEDEDYSPISAYSPTFRDRLTGYLRTHDLFTAEESRDIEDFFEWNDCLENYENLPNWTFWSGVAEDSNYHLFLHRIAQTIVETEGRELITLRLLMGKTSELAEDEEEKEETDAGQQ